MSYLVHLPHFEGPLGLLLYLIRKDEMNIMDINIHDITKTYLEYIKLMKELDLEVAGEFIAMAATLLHIKSRMLLPQYDDHGEIVETEDPRKELVQKLLEYQKYQEASKQLYGRPLLRRDVWPRGLKEDFSGDEADEMIVLDEGGLFSLISSYRRAVKNMKKSVHNVRAKAMSIAGRIMQIKDRLVVGTRLLMHELVTDGIGRRTEILITFLSMLELARMGYVWVFQNEVYGDIHIEPKQVVERNILERVQEFDSQDVEAVAAQLIEGIDVGEELPETPQLNLVAQDSDIQVVPESVATDEEILLAEAEWEQEEPQREPEAEV